MEVRSDLVNSAVKFLQDPKVQEAPLAKRIAFLESKGMTQQEIEMAMNQTGTGTPSSSVAPPIPPRQASYDWKDYVLGTMSVCGVSYGLWQLMIHYVLPHVQFPSKSSIETDTEKIESSLTVANESLETVSTQNKELLTFIESSSKEVNATLESLASTISDIQTYQTKRQEELESLKKDLESIKSMMPSIMDRAQEQSTVLLNDLSTEIKSLKSLMVNKRLAPEDKEKPKPAIPAWQLKEQENKE